MDGSSSGKTGYNPGSNCKDEEESGLFPGSLNTATVFDDSPLELAGSFNLNQSQPAPHSAHRARSTDLGESMHDLHATLPMLGGIDPSAIFLDGQYSAPSGMPVLEQQISVDNLTADMFPRQPLALNMSNMGLNLPPPVDSPRFDLESTFMHNSAFGQGSNHHHHQHDMLHHQQPQHHHHHHTHQEFSTAPFLDVLNSTDDIQPMLGCFEEYQPLTHSTLPITSNHVTSERSLPANFIEEKYQTERMPCAVAPQDMSTSLMSRQQEQSMGQNVPVNRDVIDDNIASRRNGTIASDLTASLVVQAEKRHNHYNGASDVGPQQVVTLAEKFYMSVPTEFPRYVDDDVTNPYRDTSPSRSSINSVRSSGDRSRSHSPAHSSLNDSDDEFRRSYRAERKDNVGKKDRSRKTGGCTCKKSQCVKRYCACFSEGRCCDETCECAEDCLNTDTPEMRDERAKFIAKTMKRNGVNVFADKTTQTAVISCNCTKSGCQKNYCVCYQRGVACVAACKCIGCQNTKDSHFVCEEKKLKADSQIVQQLAYQLADMQVGSTQNTPRTPTNDASGFSFNHNRNNSQHSLNRVDVDTKARKRSLPDASTYHYDQ